MLRTWFKPDNPVLETSVDVSQGCNDPWGDTRDIVYKVVFEFSLIVRFQKIVYLNTGFATVTGRKMVYV